MAFELHARVQMSNDPTAVGKIEGIGPSYAGEQYYHVFWGGTRGTSTVSEHDLRAHQALATPTDALVHGRVSGYADFQRVITLQRLLRDQPLKNNVYAFNASRTRFLPYQFKPLLKFLESPRGRLLICDEVGLGKTIEAGLILLELRARQTLRNTLVVCPSNLRPKWRLELRNRFGEEFEILDSSRLHSFFDDYLERPERSSINGIVSLETIRTERARARLEELGIQWDLIIVDEAHHLRNLNTAQRDAAEFLTSSAQSVVMLTATPVHLGVENLFSLLNLLDSEGFPELETTRGRFQENEFIVRAQSALSQKTPQFDTAAAMLDVAATVAWESRKTSIEAVAGSLRGTAAEFPNLSASEARRAVLDHQRDVAELNLLGHILTRTRKRDVQVDVAVRRAQAVEVTFSTSERAFYDRVSEAILRRSNVSQDAPVVRSWRLLTPQRRLASSLQGLVEFYREKSGGTPPTEDDTGAFEALVGAMGSPADATDSTLQKEIDELVSQWPEDGPDAKYDALRTLLQELERKGERADKVLIFASFKHTIRYLVRRLERDGVRAIGLHGDIDIDERPSLIARFKDDESVRVLISSRVGSEGLDFQFCSVLVNYDLPWNPMEVEQRIGRIDRIGQQAKTLLICNLWVDGTIEERILRRLYDRLGIFERTVGDLETIIGEVAGQIQESLVKAVLSPAESEHEVERIARVLDQQARDQDSLERSAAQFIGVDTFFDEEVNAIRQQRRYVTGEQLYRFVYAFLQREAPKARLEYDIENKRGTLVPDQILVRMLKDTGRAGEALNIITAQGAGLPVTFDAQVAFEQPGLEFFSVLHPLVLTIAEHFERSSQETAAHHVCLFSKTLPPGFYVFGVFRSHVRSARSYYNLDAVFVDDQLKVVADGQLAELVLGEVVEKGQSADGPIEIDPQFARAANSKVEIGYVQVLRRIVDREAQVNDAFVDQRLATLEAYYRRTMGKHRELLDRAESKNREERYVRMLRGRLVNMESELIGRRRELERLRSVTSDHSCIAAGVLEILQ